MMRFTFVSAMAMSSSLLLLLLSAGMTMTTTNGFQLLPPPSSFHQRTTTTKNQQQQPQPLAMAGGDDDNSPFGSLLNKIKGDNENNDRNDDVLPRATRPIEDPVPPLGRSTQPVGTQPVGGDDVDINKFDFEQRIESVKSVVIGALSGGIAMAPVSYFHYADNIPQWEFSTDMGALQAGLFAIVYRYAIREDTNPMLNQGVVGAFVVVRTLSNIRTTPDCMSVPLRCGEPLGYVNWDMLEQAAFQGVESAVLFGAAMLAMDFAFSKGWLSKFY